MSEALTSPPVIVVDHTGDKLNFVYNGNYESTHRMIARVGQDGCSVTFDWKAVLAAVEDFPSLSNRLGTPNIAALLWAAYDAGLHDA